MNNEKKTGMSGVDATDLDEVRGSLRASEDQYKMSDDELDSVVGAGRAIGGWDVSSVKSIWDVSTVSGRLPESRS